MTLDRLALQVFPGDGVVTRVPGACLAVTPRSPRQAAIAEQLLDWTRTTAPGTGRQWVRRIVGLIAVADPDDVPALCAVAEVDAGLAVLLHGALQAFVQSPAGEDRFSGSDLVTWVERVVPLSISQLEVAPELSIAPGADTHLDLTSGAVRGSGYRLTVASSVDAPSPVVPHSARAAEATPVLHVAALEDVELDEVPESHSIARPDDTSACLDHAQDERVVVTGVMCSRGHFNSPEGAFCSSCGISMVQLTHSPVHGVRPPIGYIVLDDGSTFSVDGSYVIGREPGNDAEVRAGRARPLTLADPDRKISRSHASIDLDKWAVRITDCHSVNGTFVRPPEDNEWTRLALGQPTTLEPGTRVRIGDHTLVLDSHHRVERSVVVSRAR
jgi:hypothetical protein